ncbi:MAG: oxaloacetate decarboxylase [Myxococcota bacterium]|jgi:methylisocitrate lyase|nr:carboxyvinyl-carboxyphosphonate phosphorylmutase [Deltaproteobacteria bacterium]MCP4245029.1 oxaloacetate decarboxylase [bacterium]MDP6075597.1 oxaloacetate decarboxylase [Myxococcota bacterium]MDP6242719.1 oxaloacetate decarboxylase [Myxococcota bacterium]MDP7074508.1 oxaloacetate decarboxylase [Myxococcota bacterium]
MGKKHPLIEESKVLISAGVWDVLSAKLAERAGFHTVVLSGYAVSATYLGEPDFGLLTQTEILDVARRVCRAVSIRVIVDGDTGFGGPLNVIHMVEALIEMGAAGVILEDQTWPKRCGHMRGKSVIPMQEHVAKIRAAVEVRNALKPSFIVTARTDARGPLGLDAAIERGKAYREAGASVIFVEAPESEAEMKRITSEIPGLKTVNNIEGGKTPILPLERAHELGFVSVGFVLTGLYAAAKALRDAYAHLLEHGSSAGLEASMMRFDEFGELLGLEEKYALDEKFGAD